ncbi:hypothetical protein KUCAC02_002633%2C partial [Scomber scombrus]|uniref:Uncharacterized protein n=1 Tax=Scomber scombrus TaxID=13677 RepID=A0AAV1PY77_SCOSC
MVKPELSRLAKEFKSQFDMEADRITEHHELGPSAVKREHDTIDKIKAAILSHGNPFTTEGDKLHNVITQAYIPDEYVQHILNADATGQKLFEDYVSERINGDVSLWAPVKKENNKMFLSGNKKITVKLRSNTVDLKETKDLFARLMVLARSKKDLVFEENNHEEADTLLIYQAVLASQRNPHDAQLVFYSPDTDVLVLVTANYDIKLKNTSISMASGVVQIEPLWLALDRSPLRPHIVPTLSPHHPHIVSTSSPHRLHIVSTSPPHRLHIIPTSPPHRLYIVPTFQPNRDTGISLSCSSISHYGTKDAIPTC